MSLLRNAVTRANAVSLAAVLVGVFLVFNGAFGGETTAASNSSTAPVVAVQLEPVEVGYSYMSRGLPLLWQSTPFGKEPSPGGNKSLRGTLLVGQGSSNALAFVWDRTAGKLYLDLNRNLDLTDDPAGVFTCRDSAYPRTDQTFTNILLSSQTLSGKREWRVDLNFYGYGSRPNCSARMHSFAQGKATLHGSDWQAGILENPFGTSSPMDGAYLLLRPWAERDAPFNTYAGSFEAISLPRKLFVQNHAYRLDCTNELTEDGVRLKLQFAEEHPASGELKITGDFVRRLVLEGGPYLVIVDEPQSEVKVPAGRYSLSGVWVKKGHTEAYREAGYRQLTTWVTIDEKKPATLTAGGPLTNSVALSRRGKHLSLSYSLLGAGGEVYQLKQQDLNHPPEFAVYKGDEKIASGKFQFG